MPGRLGSVRPIDREDPAGLGERPCDVEGRLTAPRGEDVQWSRALGGAMCFPTILTSILRTVTRGSSSSIESSPDESSLSNVIPLALWFLASTSRRLCSLLTSKDIELSDLVISSSVGIRHGSAYVTISVCALFGLRNTVMHVGYGMGHIRRTYQGRCRVTAGYLFESDQPWPDA